MKSKIKFLALFTCVIPVMMLFAACGAKTAEGQITAIDNNTITVALGETTTQSSDETTAPPGEDGKAPSGDNAATPDNTAADSETTESGANANSGDSTGNDSDNATPPQKPEGDTGESGEAPSNDAAGGTPANMPGGTFTASGDTITVDASDITVTLSDNSEGSVDDLAVGDILSITYSGDDKVSAITVETTAGNNGSQSQSESMDLTGATTVDGKSKSVTSGTYSSENSDENALLVTNSGDLTASGITVAKSGDTSSEDNSNFYGLNAAVAAAKGSSLTLSNADINSDADGANAIFSTGDNSSVTVSDTTINTTGNSARGLDATYGGMIDATNMKITTTGAHCAPVATDRGEGTITIRDSTLSAAGDGSPCIYSTGDITAENVTGTASGSQAAVIEGKNAITLNQCDLTGAGENGVMLYQSTSGDAGEGTGVLTSTDSTISTTSDGPMFYITNTDAKINLSNTTLNFSSGTLLKASGNNTNNWGEEGSNGGNVTLTAKYQILSGDILCDGISSVVLNLGYSSTYVGALNSDNSGGSVTLNLGKTATLTLAGDSYVSVLSDKDERLSNIVGNGHTLYYDAANDANAWLDGKTITLDGGGSVAPM